MLGVSLMLSIAVEVVPVAVSELLESDMLLDGFVAGVFYSFDLNSFDPRFILSRIYIFR